MARGTALNRYHFYDYKCNLIFRQVKPDISPSSIKFKMQVFLFYLWMAFLFTLIYLYGFKKSVNLPLLHRLWILLCTSYITEYITEYVTEVITEFGEVKNSMYVYLIYMVFDILFKNFSQDLILFVWVSVFKKKFFALYFYFYLLPGVFRIFYKCV